MKNEFLEKLIQCHDWNSCMDDGVSQYLRGDNGKVVLWINVNEKEIRLYKYDESGKSEESSIQEVSGCSDQELTEFREWITDMIDDILNS